MGCFVVLTDFLRCSVTFDTPEKLLTQVKSFIKAIEKKENNLKCFSKVLRVKNGFKNIISNWKSSSDAEYADIKINLIMNNKDNTQAQIVEIQFLVCCIFTCFFFFVRSARFDFVCVTHRFLKWYVPNSTDTNHIQSKDVECLWIQLNI